MPAPIELNKLLSADGEGLAELFFGWRQDPPSIDALLKEAVAHFGIPTTALSTKDIFNVAAAADLPAPNPYHNNDHFREVTAVMIRLIDTHNRFFEPKLDVFDISKCLIAAAGHDLGHRGTKNDFQFEQEDKTINEIRKLVALDDRNFEDIRLMVRKTDIGCYADQQKVDIPADNQKLRLMADMLADADITPSTATSFTFNKMVSALLSQEIAYVQPTAKNLLDFIAYAIGENYKSPAGRQAFGQSLNAVRETAKRHL